MRARRVVALAGAMVILATCASDDGGGVTTTTMTTTTTRTTTTVAVTTTTARTTTTITLPPTTTAPPPTVAPPVRVEDLAVDVGAAWPVELGTVGPTSVRGLVPGTDDAPPGDGDVLPPTPAVPHGYALANAGPMTAKVVAYDHADPVAAAAWVEPWAEYAQRPPVEYHEGRTLVAPTPVPDDGSGWSGLVLDRVERPSDPGTWTRAVHLVRAVDRRAYRVEVAWTGPADGDVPELVPAARSLAAAQDAHAAALPAPAADPSAGAPADLAIRVAPMDTLVAWAALAGEPGRQPLRRWAESTTASPTAMPAGAAAAGANLYAERYLIGDDGRPLVLAVVGFAAPDAAAASAARWGEATDGFGPFTFAGLGVPTTATVTVSAGVVVAEVPGGVAAAVEFDSEAGPFTLGGAWFVSGARAYAVVVSAPGGLDANTQIAAGVLRQQAARLSALGL